MEIFYDILYRCIDQAIPKKVDRGANGGRRYPVYFTVELVRDIREKSKLYKLCRSRNTTDFQMIEYRNLRRTVKNRTKNEFKLYQQNIENNVNVDPSSFWTYVKAKSKQNGIPQVMNLGNNSFSEPQFMYCTYF